MKHRTRTIQIPSARHQFLLPYSSAIGPRFAVKAAADVAEITLYDEIGFWGISADDVRRALDEITAPEIRLRINSPGGEVFDGLAIYNDLLAHPAAVTVEITGIAASIASIIAMAGDTIGIADNGFFMIHNAWTFAWGDRHDLLATAAVLNQIDGALALTYAARTGGELADMAELMDSETWLVGAAAVEAGFADQTIPGDDDDVAEVAPVDGTRAYEFKTLFDLSKFNRVPAALKRSNEDRLRTVGFSKREARAAVAQGFEDLPRREAVGRTIRREAGAGEAALLQGADALVARIRAVAG